MALLIVTRNEWCEELAECRGGHCTEPNSDAMAFVWHGEAVGLVTGYVTSQHGDGRDRLYQLDRQLIANLKAQGL